MQNIEKPAPVIIRPPRPAEFRAWIVAALDAVGLTATALNRQTFDGGSMHLIARFLREPERDMTLTTSALIAETLCREAASRGVILPSLRVVE